MKNGIAITVNKIVIFFIWLILIVNIYFLEKNYIESNEDLKSILPSPNETLCYFSRFDFYGKNGDQSNRKIDNQC